MELVTDKPLTRPKRSYSDAERAKVLTALDLNEGNLLRTSQQTGIPLKTLADWRDGRINSDVVEIRKQQKQDLAQRFEDLAHLYISQAVDTVESSKGTQAITGAGIAVDKMRLLREQSTQNVAMITISQPLQNWIQKTQPSAEIIEQKVTQIAEQNGINAQELLSAVMGETSYKPE